MWILISHFTIWPRMVEIVPLPWAYVATLAAGVLVWLVAERVIDTTCTLAGMTITKLPVAPPTAHARSGLADHRVTNVDSARTRSAQPPSPNTLEHHMNPITTHRVAAMAAVLGVAALAGCGGEDGPVLQVYSGRHYGIETAFEQFTDETGIELEFQTGNDGELRERLAAEGEDTEADVYITVDAGNLVAATDQGLFQPIDSDGARCRPSRPNSATRTAIGTA